jgi:3-hydroxyacyl-CoA dehydrogenase
MRTVSRGSNFGDAAGLASAAARSKLSTLGRKSGRGFYDYPGGEKGPPTRATISPLSHVNRTPLFPDAVTSEFLAKADIQSPDDELSAEIIARILSMIINEAAFAVGEGVAAVADVDLAMKLGTNYPQGPLQWADRIGLDLVVSVLQHLWQTVGEERYRVAPLMRRLVAMGATGDAAGSGFHSPGEAGMV